MSMRNILIAAGCALVVWWWFSKKSAQQPSVTNSGINAVLRGALVDKNEMVYAADAYRTVTGEVQKSYTIAKSYLQANSTETGSADRNSNA